MVLTSTAVDISLKLADYDEGQTYTVSYSNTDCSNDTYNPITNITGTIYTLTDLEEGTNYSITVTVTLGEQWHREYNLTATTMTTG